MKRLCKNVNFWSNSMQKKQRLLWGIPLLGLSYIIYIRTLICYPAEPSATPWGAPIVWEGTFDHEKEINFHQKRGTVVGLSVFAVGKYLDAYLKDFLISANRYFMLGLPCVVYVLTDRVSDVPKINVRSGMSITTLQVSKRDRWQDISMLRMMDLMEQVLPLADKDVHYLFCMDVDQIFTSDYGPETLGDLVAQLHSGFYLENRTKFPYEKDPQSAAYIPPSMGVFYYHAAVFGGTPAQIANLTSTCLTNILMDKKRDVEAIWHDESHLNRYLALQQLPSKVLSPEYCWDELLRLRYHKLIWAKKNYEQLRV